MLEAIEGSGNEPLQRVLGSFLHCIQRAFTFFVSSPLVFFFFFGQPVVYAPYNVHSATVLSLSLAHRLEEKEW